MRTSSKKAKGRRLQQWACQKISKIANAPWGKDEEIASREMGQSGVDVRLSRRLRKIFSFSVETKNQESWNIHKWIEQAKQNTYENTNWIIFASRNRTKPVAILDAEVFFAIIEKAIKHDKIIKNKKFPKS